MASSEPTRGHPWHHRKTQFTASMMDLNFLHHALLRVFLTVAHQKFLCESTCNMRTWNLPYLLLPKLHFSITAKTEKNADFVCVVFPKSSLSSTKVTRDLFLRVSGPCAWLDIRPRSPAVSPVMPPSGLANRLQTSEPVPLWDQPTLLKAFCCKAFVIIPMVLAILHCQKKHRLGAARKNSWKFLNAQVTDHGCPNVETQSTPIFGHAHFRNI